MLPVVETDNPWDAVVPDGTVMRAGAVDLLAYTLLHVYSNLPWYMRELHVPVEGTLESVAEAWFGTE